MNLELPKGFNEKHTVGYQLALLSPREKEVYNYLLTSMSQKQIVAKLFIAPGTLKFHLTRIYKKLKVKGRRELIGQLLENEKEKHKV